MRIHTCGALCVARKEVVSRISFYLSLCTDTVEVEVKDINIQEMEGD